ncbi:MAG: CHAT domain-containing protein [Acidobacteriota bacterium]|nr:CHAT domain-containing protein [Acidobacteriota bacterium]
MNSHLEEDNLFRRYLLNDVTPDEGQRVEDALLRGEEISSEEELDSIDRLLLAEDELIDDYARKTLSKRERKLFEERFLLTFERRKKLSIAQELVTYASAGSETKTDTLREPLARQSQDKQTWADKRHREQRHREGEWWRGFLFPGWKLVVVVALILGVGMGIWRLKRVESPVREGMMLLAQAYSAQRPVEARVTGFAYAPHFTSRGGEPAFGDYRTLDEAEVLLHKAVREHPEPEALQALGRLYLAKGDFDKAITQFELGLAASPNDARLHNDLGAALLEKSRLSQPANFIEQSKSLGRSLDELNKAVDLDEHLLDAHFNRALVRQLMGMDAQAEAGWKEYLRRDPSSPWAAEATAHLRDLEEKKKRASYSDTQLLKDFVAAYDARDESQAWNLYKASRSRAGNVIADKLIESWLAAPHPKEAEERLAQLLWAGKLEQRNVGDGFTLDLATFYQRLGASQREAIRSARFFMKQAAESYNESNWSQAAQLFAHAQQAFQKIGNGCEANLAQSWVGYCLTRLERSEQAIGIFNQLSFVCLQKNYKSLLAYVLQTKADAYTAQDKFSEALETARDSLQIAEQQDIPLCILRNQGLLASVTLALGKYDESLRAAIQGVALSSKNPIDPKQVWGVYSTLPNSLLALEYKWAALGAQREVQELAVRSGWAAYQALSNARLGMIHSRLGRYDEALKYAERSLEESHRAPDPEARRHLIADALFFRAQLLREAGNFAPSLKAYQQAIEAYSQTSSRFYTYKAFVGSFLSSLALKNEEEAARNLNAVNEILKNFRRQLFSESDRNAFFDTEQKFYDAAIDFELAPHRSAAKAFQLSEESRARSLLDARYGPRQVVRRGSEAELRLQSLYEPLDLATIQQRLPPEIQLVQYSSLPNKLVAWVITRDTVVQVQTPAIELEAKVAALAKLLTTRSVGKSETIKRLSEDLHQLLITPIEPHLVLQKPVCLILDKALHQLPMALLRSGRTGKYFIEDYPFMVSPSSTAFILFSEVAGQKERKGRERLLSLGNPQPAQSSTVSFPDLANAASEAEAVAKLYSQPRLLIGSGATESAFRKQAPFSEVIHIASHAVSNRQSPLLSSLLLTPDPFTPSPEVADGNLQAYEIYQLNLSRTKLIVLSACETGVGRSFDGEGVMSLARPFLIAGAPVVIASLWSIESKSAERLMVAFHQCRIREGQNVMQALRQAQLKLLREEQRADLPATDWASFSVYGGFSAY